MSISFAAVLSLIVILMIALQFSWVQTYVSKKITNYLSKELDSKISLKQVYFKPFNALLLDDFTVQDHQGDTILHANRLTANFDLLHLLDNKITIKTVKLQDTYLDFHLYKDSSNFSKYIRYFSSPKKDNKQKNKLTLNLGSIELVNNHIKFRNHKYSKPRKGVDFANLDIKDLSIKIKDISLDSTSKFTIERLTLKEKSGLYIQDLRTKVSYSAKRMSFDNLYVKTNRSLITDYLRFDYDKISDFDDFMNKVQVTAQLKNSFVESKDIDFFAPSMEKVIFQTAVQSAKLHGTVSDIHAKDVQLSTAKNTNLHGDFSIKGLPYIQSTVFDFVLTQLQTSAQDVETIVPLLSNKGKFTLPTQLHQLKNLNFAGKFKGFYNNFNLDGKFQTALGELQTNTDIDIRQKLTYAGKISGKKFNVGDLIISKDVKNTDFNIDFKGQGLNLDDLNLTFDAQLKNSSIKNYTYDNIKANGTISKKTLDIRGDITDNNLILDYNSSINWQTNTPNYVLNARVNRAALNKLGWIKKDSIEVQSATINTNLVGNSLNSLIGHLYADSIRFSTTKGDFLIKKMNFEAQQNESTRNLTLQSDALDAKMSGIIDLNTIVPYFKSLAMRYAPAINIGIEPYNSQNFNLEINVKSFKPIAPLLDPSLTLEDGAHLNADFSSDDFTAHFIAYSPSVTYKGIQLQNLAIEENANKKAFSLNIFADKMNFGDSIYIKNIAINNVLANDSLNFNIELSEKTATNYLNLNGNVHFAANAPAYIHFNPSSIIINKENWHIHQNALLRVSKGKIYLNDLSIYQDQQQIKLNGILSNENDELDISFNKFSLSSLQGITSPLGIDLKGMMNGKVTITSVFKNPFTTANITTTPILYNQIPIGELDLNLDYDTQEGGLNIDLNLLDSEQRGIIATGNYNFKDQNSPLDLKANLKETDLIIFQPFLKKLISNLQGKGNAEIAITGTLNKPIFSGIGRFPKGSFTVNYLNTQYQVANQMAMVDNNIIMLNNFKINDSKGSTALANGMVNLSKLANPYIDIDATSTDFMILNTSFKDNNLYYGKANATGTFKFKGYSSAIAIDINAKSEPGTVLNIPFNSAMTISESDFIYFVSKDSVKNKERENRASFKGLTMNMALNLSQNAEVNLQTSLGSLRGTGNGEVTMKISSLGDFEMFGDYIINNGKFHFTAQDFINKYFDIKEGGTIRWTGKPSDAVINLNAIYQQRTAVGPLYNAAGRAGEDERVLAQADMLIKGTLDHPDISFDLNFPQNPYIKDQLQSFLSDANNVNQQALSLIVRRSFTPSSTNEIGKEVNNTLLSAGTEIAFNQLNNIISESLNINFFDLNIRSLNDASASIRLLNDRLVLTGGITDRTNYLANDLTFFREGFTTDAELTYRLRKDGNLLFRAYNRPYTRNFLIRSMDSEYISAVGLVYRREFNSMHEFWKSIWYWKRKSDKEAQKNKETK